MDYKQENCGWKLELTELTYSTEIGKIYRIENNAVVSKTNGNGFNGTFRTLGFSSFAGLCALQNGLAPHQCLIAGTSTVDAEYGSLGPYLERCHERTKEWFPEPYCHALITCDIDRGGAPPALQAYMGRAEDVAALFCELVPELRRAALLVRPSSSNGVCYADGGPANAGGWHVHMVAPPGKRVEFMERLYAAFVWAGFGWILVSKPNERTGIPSLLKRNPVDTALLIPNQPIYSGPPRVEVPLVLKRPACFIQEGCAVDPDWLPDHGRKDVEHLYDEMKQTPDVQAEIEAAVAHVAERRVPHGVADRERAFAEAVVQVRKQLENARRGVLGPEVEIHLHRGPVVTVAQILAEPKRYDRSLTLTPGEPEYRDYSQTGIIYAGEKGVKLHTQAHGGITYTLLGFDPDKLIAKLTRELDPPTCPLPPEEAKRRLRAALALWPRQEPSLAVKATQGLGKTEEVLARMGEEPELRFLFLAANLKQCQQAYDVNAV